MITIKNLKIGYENTNKYQIYIIINIIIKILRGIRFRIFGVKAKGYFLVGKAVKIYGSYHNLKTGKDCKIESNAIIQTISLHGINLGDHVTIGKGVQIRPSGLYNGEVGEGLWVGDYTSIGVDSYIGCSGKIIIGSYVMIGPKVTMIAENHRYSDIDKPMLFQGVVRKGIIIQDNVWIGANVTILDGVTVGAGSIIGAGAIVTKNIPPYSVAVGNPARIIKSRKNNV